MLRYSALFFGVFYGFYHQSTLSAKAKLAEIDREYHHKESLIQQAKAEFAKKNMPAESKTEGGQIITDPEDKNFDLEAYLNVVSADSAK